MDDVAYSQFQQNSERVNEVNLSSRPHLLRRQGGLDLTLKPTIGTPFHREPAASQGTWNSRRQFEIMFIRRLPGSTTVTHS